MEILLAHKAVGISNVEDTINRKLTKNVRKKKKAGSFSRGAKANKETKAYLKKQNTVTTRGGLVERRVTRAERH